MPEHRSPLILFIIKRHQSYGAYNQGHNSLKTATLFIVEMLKREGHRVKLAEASDENSVETFILDLDPTLVILEALWVTPKKMEWLKKTFPKVRFVVRINSEVPFLAQEGIGVLWIADFMALGIDVAFNSIYARDDFMLLGDSVYLPNYYPMQRLRHEPRCHEHHVNVGCFGALRILKNQTEQAFAAAKWAQDKNKRLHFHMNDAPDGVEVNAIKKSIKAVIDNTGGRLILHPWLPHDEFLELVESMDICLQVSISETLDICAADAVSMGVPLVGSDAIRWLPARSKAKYDSSNNITDAMHLADKVGVALNHAALEEYVKHSVLVWNEFIEGKHV